MPLVKAVLAIATIAIVAPIAVAAQTATAPNPVRGKQLFLQCQACHTVVPGARHSVGPNLAGVPGAKAASRPGFAYSEALTRSGLVWNSANLDAFLKRPSQAVPGTKMAYGGLADARARADIIAYLTTLKGKK